MHEMHAKSKKNVNFLTIDTRPYKKSTIVKSYREEPVYFFTKSKALTSALWLRLPPRARVCLPDTPEK